MVPSDGRTLRRSAAALIGALSAEKSNGLRAFILRKFLTMRNPLARDPASMCVMALLGCALKRAKAK